MRTTTTAALVIGVLATAGWAHEDEPRPRVERPDSTLPRFEQERVVQVHTSVVRTLTFVPGRDLLVSGAGGSGEIKLSRPTDGAEVGRFAGHY